MKIFLYIKLILLIFIFFTNSSFSKINNSIVAKVGNQIITRVDIENEIKTILILQKKEFNDENIKSAKDIAVKTLVRKLIKKNEIVKYKIEKYSQQDLDNHLKMISKNLGTNKQGLKNLLETNNIDYEEFIEKFKIELLWNTLIYSMYKNQLNINTVEIESELKRRIEIEGLKREYNLSEIEIQYDKEKINQTLKNVYEIIEKEGFESAVKKFSISSSSSNKGNIGWVSENILSKNYLVELRAIDIGKITRPIKNSNSVVILKIIDIKEINNNNNIDVDKIKKNIITKKKEEKLDLFSRSHFSKIENSILISFQ